MIDVAAAIAVPPGHRALHCRWASRIGSNRSSERPPSSVVRSEVHVLPGAYPWAEDRAGLILSPPPVTHKARRGGGCHFVAPPPAAAPCARRNFPQPGWPGD